MNMNYDPVIEEIHEARRKLWAECDGTMEGYSRHCEEVAREFRARVAAEVAREKAEGRSPAEQGGESAGRRVPSRRRKQPAFADATMVREGEAPRYGAGGTSDLARKGAEGDAV